MKKDNTKPLGKVIKIDESEIRGHLDKLVRGTVEESVLVRIESLSVRISSTTFKASLPIRVSSRLLRMLHRIIPTGVPRLMVEPHLIRAMK